MDRSFHQFGILVASIVMAIGLTLIAGAVIFRLNLMETLADRELALALGGALVVLGIFSIASYCVVRPRQPTPRLVPREAGYLTPTSVAVMEAAPPIEASAIP